MFSWQLGPKERLYYVCLTQRKRMSSKQISQEDCHKLENNFRYLACQVRTLCSVDFPQVSRILIHFFLFPCIRFFQGIYLMHSSATSSTPFFFSWSCLPWQISNLACLPSRETLIGTNPRGGPILQQVQTRDNLLKIQPR